MSAPGGDVVVEVVVVGAGPIGLTAALELARYGIPSVVLEAEQQVSEGEAEIDPACAGAEGEAEEACVIGPGIASGGR